MGLTYRHKLYAIKKRHDSLLHHYIQTVPVAGYRPANTSESIAPKEALGQLVVLGFDVTVFTPAPYLRRRLQRPSVEFSSRGGLRT